MISNMVSPSSQQVCYIRKRWVDVAKSLGLFLVFWGHTLYSGSEAASLINRTIYSFHMPMYFILSGYVLKPDSKPFIEYFKNKFNRIFLPALIVYIFTLPIYFYSLDYSTTTAYIVIVKVFYIAGLCAYNAPIWFFFCMFQVLMVSKLLNLSNASNSKLIKAALSFLFLTYIMYVSEWKYFNLFGINKCVLGLFFYSCGIILKRTNYEKQIMQIGTIALPLWALSGVLLNNTLCSMYAMNLGALWLYILSGITGTLAIFMVCKYLENIKKLQDYAKWIIFIVSSHYVFVTLIKKFASLLSIKGTYAYDIISFLYVLLVLYAYKYVCQIIERKIPILIGR